MRNKNFIFFLFILLTNMALAQKIEIKWSKEICPGLDIRSIFDESHGFFYCMSFWGQNWHGREIYKLSKVDANGKIKYSKRLKIKSLQGHRFEFLNVFYYQDKFIVFSSGEENFKGIRKYVLYASFFNHDGDQVGVSTLVDSMGVQKNIIIGGPPLIRQSVDKSKLMVLSWLTSNSFSINGTYNKLFDGSPVLKFNMCVLDTNLKVLSSCREQRRNGQKCLFYLNMISYPPNWNKYNFQSSIYQDYNKQSSVSNKGTVYLGALYPDSQFKIVKYLPAYGGGLLKRDTNEILLGKTDKIAWYPALLINNSGNGLLFSEYGNISYDFKYMRNINADSSFYVFLNEKKDDSTVKKFFKNNISNSDKFIGTKQLLAHNRNVLDLKYSIDLIDILGRKDGGFYIGICQHINDTVSKSKQTNFFVISLTSSGQIDWINSLPSTKGVFLPFALEDDKIAFIYPFYKIVSNLDSNKIDNVYMVTFDKHGKQSSSLPFVGSQINQCYYIQTINESNKAFFYSSYYDRKKNIIGALQIN